jgi:DOPA 4,5-dioxygenase
MNTNTDITGFHAHIYFDTASREAAARVGEGLGAKFDVRLGRWHEQPIGPHPKSMYQVAFLPHQFGEVVTWLMLNREGLDIKDHTDNSLWLGEKLSLNIEFLQRLKTI